jgi:hypothetical protein
VRVSGVDTASKSFRIGDVNFIRELFAIDVYADTYRGRRINGVRVATWSSRDGWSGDSRPDAEWLQ